MMTGKPAIEIPGDNPTVRRIEGPGQYTKGTPPIAERVNSGASMVKPTPNDKSALNTKFDRIGTSENVGKRKTKRRTTI